MSNPVKIKKLIAICFCSSTTGLLPQKYPGF
jgi:hypothetical protein